jgi:hypothetical protein
MNPRLFHLPRIGGYLVALILPASLAFAAGDARPASFEAFARSAVKNAMAPAGLSRPLLALWHAKAGAWESAHQIAQEITTPAGSWIHAFLHREEGDEGNAAYWYRKAGKEFPKGIDLATEWELIAREIWQGEHGITPGQEVFTSCRGLVALSTTAATPAEGAFDTLLRKDGRELVRFTGARPVSFSPDGRWLLLREAGGDDDLRHFLLDVSGEIQQIPEGRRQRVGGRHVERAKWAPDGKSVTLFSHPGLDKRAQETIALPPSP